MDFLDTLTCYSGMALLGGFLAVVLWKLAAGEISVDGLLESFDQAGKRTSSPGRVQLLVITLAVAGKYLLTVIQDPSRDSLPTIPNELMILLAGSHGLYLSGKTLITFRPLLKKLK